MRLFIIRHAIAAERSPDAPDDARPLTRRGKRRFRRASRGLARLYAKPDILLTSPLVRARQTARLAARAWKTSFEEDSALAGGSAEDLAARLARLPAESTVALVGHEPQVSEFLARLLGSKHPDRLTFKKGGVAVVDLPAGPDGVGALVGVLPPRVLRRAR